MLRAPSLSGRRLLGAVTVLALLAGLLALPTSQPAADASSKTPIMGESSLSPAQIAGWFRATRGMNGYKAAVSPEFLAAYFVFEGEREGVAGDLAFAQAVHETGSFRYGGQVHPSQHNYGGIGATDNGAAGAFFPSPRIGVRAQIQHLRAYADPTVTVNNLAYPLESPRFHLVNPKGRTRFWEDMGGGNWATDPNYATAILNLYASMRAFANANPHLQGRWMFSDVPAGHTFEHDIISIAIADITRGCGGDRYCPNSSVTREQMASFLVRALDLPSVSGNRFRDVSGTHAADVNALAAAGITKGCNPPKNDLFCPKNQVTRAQMATFLARGRGLSPSSSNQFLDVPSTNPHQRDINAVARAGITRGCNPPANDRFCPGDSVTRAQMAAFLTRAFG